MANRSGLKKVTKSVRGKHGSVRRSYWVKSSPKAAAQQKQPGFLRRNAGKIAVGAVALAGAAYLAHRGLKNRGMIQNSSPIWKGSIAHAHNAPNIAHGSIAHSGGAKESMQTHSTFRDAKIGILNAQSGARNYRRTVGADLGRHLATTGGEALAGHVGSKFGGIAGTAVGGLLGHGPGAAVGGFIGQQAGGFLANRHTAPHIQRGAEWLHKRLSR